MNWLTKISSNDHLFEDRVAVPSALGGLGIVQELVGGPIRMINDSSPHSL